jgi:TPR repeat protein
MVSRYAQKWIRDARTGNPTAQLWLGKLYLSGGEGMARNLRAALHWLTLAAKTGIEAAVLLVAEEIPMEVGVESNDYASMCEHAATLGSTVAHARIGDLNAESNPEKAVRGYQTAAQHGYMYAAYRLGVLLQRHPALVTVCGHDATYWFELAANSGDLAAAQSLAEMLWRSRDLQAPMWLDKVARAGDVQAMYRLGVWLIEEGREPGDAPEGAYWLEMATRKGHPRAMWLYGRMHARSLFQANAVVPNSLIQAARLLERAAALGVTEALYDLARIYAMPRFSGRDLLKSRQYLERAAEGGDTEAELELGTLLARDRSDKAALMKAGRWLSRAAAKGSTKAVEVIREIADRPPEIAESIAISQEHALDLIKEDYPTIAARLGLAATFGLNTRETVFVDPLDAYQDWCLKVDLSKYFKYQNWRLITIESEAQRRVIHRACSAFRDPWNLVNDLTGLETRNRTRQLASVLTGAPIELSAFIHDWVHPS